MDDRAAMSVTEDLPPNGHHALLPEVPRRHWWLTLLMGLVIFVSGGVCGVGIGMRLERLHFLEILHNPERGPERIVARMRSRLQLDDRQAQQVQAIVEKHVAALQDLHRRIVDPLLAKQLEQFEAEVADVLNPQQQVEWHDYMKPLPERWYPLLPPKSSSPKAPL
jgi:hypothetical protein